MIIPRNVPDDVLAQLPDNGGVCMITFVPAFVSPAVRAWQLEVEAAARAAGVDVRDLAAMDEFVQPHLREQADRDPGRRGRPLSARP